MNFQIIKETVSAVDVWQLYGGSPITSGSAVNCIYHSDKRPSMRLYDGSRGFYCFACNAGGDSIKLTADLLGLSPIEAVKRLNADFNIGLDLDKPPDKKIMNQLMQRRSAVEQFEEWRNGALRTLGDYHRMLWQAQKEIQMPPESITPLQFEALNELEKTAYYLTCLEDDPMDFYKANRDHISKIARRLEGMNEIATIQRCRPGIFYDNRKGRPCCKHERPSA